MQRISERKCGGKLDSLRVIKPPYPKKIFHFPSIFTNLDTIYREFIGIHALFKLFQPFEIAML